MEEWLLTCVPRKKKQGWAGELGLACPGLLCALRLRNGSSRIYSKCSCGEDEIGPCQNHQRTQGKGSANCRSSLQRPNASHSCPRCNPVTHYPYPETENLLTPGICSMWILIENLKDIEHLQICLQNIMQKKYSYNTGNINLFSFTLLIRNPVEYWRQQIHMYEPFLMWVVREKLLGSKPAGRNGAK